MAMTIGFNTVQEYLSRLASLGSIGASPHKAFWKSKIVGGAPVPITYSEFLDGTVPHVTYRGSPIPIVWKEFPLLSPLLLVLAEPAGYAGIDQMIPGGPHLTDAHMTITLSNGTTVTGAKVLDDLAAWLQNGFPEHPVPIPELA